MAIDPDDFAVLVQRLDNRLTPGEELSPIQLIVLIEQDLGFDGAQAISGIDSLDRLVIFGCLEQLPSKMYCWLGRPGSLKRLCMEQE
jgi:hypothetical protein